MFANEDDRIRLKELNDRNLPFDETKCEKVEIVREKDRNACIYRDEARRVVEDELGLPEYCNSMFDLRFAVPEIAAIQRFYGAAKRLCQTELLYLYLFLFKTDDYGREIFVSWGYKGYDENVVVLINPDGSFNRDSGYFILTDAELFGYQDKLKALKEDNGWNEPFSPAE